MVGLDGRRASTILRMKRSGGDAREAMTVGCKPTMVGHSTPTSPANILYSLQHILLPNVRGKSRDSLFTLGRSDNVRQCPHSPNQVLTHAARAAAKQLNNFRHLCWPRAVGAKGSG